MLASGPRNASLLWFKGKRGEQVPTEQVLKRLGLDLPHLTNLESWDKRSVVVLSGYHYRDYM